MRLITISTLSFILLSHFSIASTVVPESQKKTETLAMQAIPAPAEMLKLLAKIETVKEIRTLYCTSMIKSSNAYVLQQQDKKDEAIKEFYLGYGAKTELAERKQFDIAGFEEGVNKAKADKDKNKEQAAIFARWEPIIKNCVETRHSEFLLSK